MANVRIIVKQIFRPPIDSPASIHWITVAIQADALADILNGVGVNGSEYSVFEVVGAELLPRLDKEEVK